jgi:hypothetical protein
VAVYTVKALSGSEALRKQPGMIARYAKPGEFLVFERIDDATGHPSRIDYRKAHNG